MVKELCPNIRVSNDARELVLACCTEFIHLLSSEANEMCNNQQKKTINAEHVLMALDSLGYRDDRCSKLLPCGFVLWVNKLPLKGLPIP